MKDSRQDEYTMLKALKAGDHLAFQYFYDKYGLLLYRRIQGMVRIDAVAEELLQGLFVKIWEKRGQIDLERPFKSYLHRIAENIVYDHFRNLSRKAKLERELILNGPKLSPPLEDRIQIKEVWKQANEAINRLPTQQKRVFTLCKIEGRTYEEVSTLLGISTATINTHITRASKAVKEYIFKNR